MAKPKQEYAEFMGSRLFKRPSFGDIGRSIANVIVAKPLRDSRARQRELPRLPDVSGPEPSFRNRVESLIPDPWIEDEKEKAIKETALSAYPFAESAKEVLRESARMNDLRPLSLDPFHSKGNSGIVRGRTYRGNMRLVDKEGEPRSKLTHSALSLLGPLTKRPSKISAIGKDTVVAHELLHAYTDQVGFPLSWKQFNKDFDEEVRGNEDLQSLRERISAGNRAGKSAPFDLAQERFAYIGEVYGKEGLQGIPKRLQPYYKDIFKNTELFLVPSNE